MKPLPQDGSDGQERVPPGRGLLLRSFRSVAQWARPRKAGVIASGLCLFLLLFWAYHQARTPDGRRDPSGGVPAATNRQPAVELAGGDKDTVGGAAPASLPDAMVGRTNPPPRLLWEVKTAGGLDSFSEIYPAGDRLVAMRRGVLYGLDARTGATCWRYPLVGTVHEPHEPDYAIWACSVIAVRGDRVIIAASQKSTSDNGPALIEISLQGGKALREYYGQMKYPPYRWNEHLTGPLYPVWASSEDWKKIEVSVVDLDRWCESARFSLDSSGVSFIEVRGSVVYMISSMHIITVDLDRHTMHSAPIREQQYGDFYMNSRVLPDGSFLKVEGRFNAVCGFLGTWPHPGSAYVGGDAVYVRDALGVCRVNPSTAGILWRSPIPWPYGAMIGASINKIAAGGGTIAMVERGNLYVLDAATGALRAAIRTGASTKTLRQLADNGAFRETSLVACDTSRVYVAEQSGLRAFSTHPVNPDRPDPTDPGDPAYYLANGRDALRTGDFEAALRALQGVGVAASLRKESRDEAALLLSQIARSQATVVCPEQWQDLMLTEGWIAGELFAQDYSRLRSPGPLISIGTHRSITVAAALSDDLRLWGSWGEDAFLAAEACRILTGVRPLEKHFGKSVGGPGAIAFAVPMEEEAFSRLLPRLREHGPHLLQFYGVKMSPRQVCLLAEGDTPLAQAAKLQMESMARGAGIEKKIVITRPAPPRADKGVF